MGPAYLFSAMIFRIYNQFLSQATRTMGVLALSLGLAVLSLGLLVAIFPKVFAYLVAGVLIVVGIGIVATAVRILWAGHKAQATGQDRYRVRVKVIED